MNNSSKRLQLSTTLFIGLILLTVLIGCMQATYGKFIRSNQVTHAFINGAVSPDLNYYYWGSPTRPDAIIGVNLTYTLSSDFWIAFDPQPEQLTKMSDNMHGASGSNMVAPDGTTVGVWFSRLNNKSVKVDQQSHSVEVMFKDPSHH